MQWYWSFFGIWRAGKCGTCYTWTVFTALASATVLSAYNLVQQNGRLFENVADIAFSISSLLSLAACIKLDGLRGKLLGRYATRHYFMGSWDHQGTVLLVLVNMIWLCKAIALSVYMYASEEIFSWHALSTALASLLQSGSYLAFIHRDCHLMNFLRLMVDDWAARFNQSLDCDVAADSWNTAYTTMRQVARFVETSFLAAQTSSLVAVLCCTGRVLNIMAQSGEAMQRSWMLALLELPTLMMAVCALVVFAKATDVTEKSMQIPALVNSLLSRRHSPYSHKSQAFVSFIHNSYAGVYIKGGRLNATVLMNYLYLCSAVICVLVTTAMSMNQPR